MTSSQSRTSAGLLFLLGVACLCSFSPLLVAHAARVKTVTDRDGLGVLVLPNGSQFKTTLYHLKLVGELPRSGKSPYYILSGFGCTECDANRSIYVHSPSDGPMKGEGEQRRFLYPGRESDVENHRVVYESRAFFGNCVAMYPNAVIWFERFVGDAGRWHTRVVVAEAKSDNLVIESVQTNSPKIEEAVNSVGRGQCTEIPGINRLSEP